MDRLAGGHGTLDGSAEADEFLVGVRAHATAEDDAVQDVEGGEQRGGAVALVVVGHGCARCGPERQAGRDAVKGLDLEQVWLAIRSESHRSRRA